MLVVFDSSNINFDVTGSSNTFDIDQGSAGVLNH